MLTSSSGPSASQFHLHRGPDKALSKLVRDHTLITSMHDHRLAPPTLTDSNNTRGRDDSPHTQHNILKIFFLFCYHRLAPLRHFFIFTGAGMTHSQAGKQNIHIRNHFQFLLTHHLAPLLHRLLLHRGRDERPQTTQNVYWYPE